MALTTTGTPDRVVGLEQELHDLEASEDALDQRTGNLEIKSTFVVCSPSAGLRSRSPRLP